ncbi:MAG: hypothetical protein ACLT8Y_03085 [Dorea formicigenerans]
MPTIIVECGFLSNQQEAELLAGKDYQKKSPRQSQQELTSI